MNTYTTHSGQVLDLNFIKPEDVNIEDIAHSLSFQCRFNGHTKRFYSVAEHSIILSHLVDKLSGVQNLNRRMAALLHDAAECYIGDITTPVQRYLYTGSDSEIAILQHIFSAFSIPYSCLDEELKTFDSDLAILEGYNLIGGLYWTKRRHLLYNINPEFVRIGELLINSHTGTTWENPNNMYTYFLNNLNTGLVEALTGESDADLTE